MNLFEDVVWKITDKLWSTKLSTPVHMPSLGRLNIKISSCQYRDTHVKDYKNPQHLDVVDRYLRRMVAKTFPDEAPPSLESLYP